jgi:hypothetical protein
MWNHSLEHVKTNYQYVLICKYAVVDVIGTDVNSICNAASNLCSGLLRPVYLVLCDKTGTNPKLYRKKKYKVVWPCGKNARL